MFLSTEKLDELIHRIRNIGVIAHVDAGKTTTTERMLYYSGFTSSLGSVDDGTTVTDYMDQERERGITIVSAAVTFAWKGYQLNLIDTPGHVDFSMEVERALRVLDGSVAIVDGSAGVEAQTVSVWRQADKYTIPRIIYINKMDKQGADFEASVKSIESKLVSPTPLCVQIPVIDKESSSFRGLIDLINMTKLEWNAESREDGKKFRIVDVRDDPRALHHRARLVEKLAQVNDSFAERLLDKYDMNFEQFDDNILLEASVRSSCLSNQVAPVLCGSSFRNIGVQPLMDAVCKYLPCPLDLDKNQFSKYYENQKSNLVAFCFKIIHDHYKTRKRITAGTSTAVLSSSASATSKIKLDDDEEDNALAFLRIYNGELHAKAKIYNVGKQVREEIDKIYVPFSNQIKLVNKVSNGNIAIVSGLSKTVTGDFLVSNRQAYERAHEKLTKSEDERTARLMETNVDVPPPVFFCTVEPASESDEKRLQFALSCLQREDPSLRVLINEQENLGQTIIQGMGELHLDIVKDRLLKEYKLQAFFGPLHIAYKEMPTKESTESTSFERSIGATKSRVDIELTVRPTNDTKSFESVTLDLRQDGKDNQSPYKSNKDFPPEYLQSINNGVRSAINKGVLLRYPTVNCEVILRAFNVNAKVHLPFVASAAYQCTVQALKQAECVITQPVMQLNVISHHSFIYKIYLN